MHGIHCIFFPLPASADHISGEITLGNLHAVFASIDDETGGNLSKSRYKKDKRDWASKDFHLKPSIVFFLIFVCSSGMMGISSLWHDRWNTIKEGYVVQALLSYARRYWRKSLIKTTVTPEAVQLQAVCRPNNRRARETCRKASRPGEGTPFSYSFSYVLAYGWNYRTERNEYIYIYMCACVFLL